MSKTEQNALRDLLANARCARQAAERLPKGESPRTCPRFRLLVGAYDLERAAAFLYWRAEQKKV